MGTKLFVGNLGPDTTEESLKVAFSGQGRTVRAITIPNDDQSGKPRGFAFIEMGTDADAQASIAALNGKDFGGRNIKVSAAQDRPPRTRPTGSTAPVA
jgi:RNA recognition motif-containing protein